MRNRPTYWLNNDSTGVTLHESGCAYVQEWAQPPKWQEFPTEEAARDSTRRKIRECGVCMPLGREPGPIICWGPSDTPKQPNSISRYDVVERMARRVMSEIRDNPKSDWASASGRIKREFAVESEALYSQAQCEDPHGSDLIAEAAARRAPQIRDDVVGNMAAALVAEIENSRRGMALWSSVKEKILRDNSLAIGALRESGASSAPDGSDLIGDALDNSGLQVVSRDDVLPGRIVKYLVKPRDEAPARTESRFPQR